MYSLIGQRDNRLNIEIGDASRKIAEDSKKTAEDSKKVALLTRRDSANMRIIAAVTLFFLPGTFTAVSCPLPAALASSSGALDPH